MASFNNVQLAENYSRGRSLIPQILVGMDAYWNYIDPQKAIKCGNLVALHSPFGYVLSGHLSSKNKDHHTQLICIENVSDQHLTQFWSLEGVGILPTESSQHLIERDPVFQQFREELQYSPSLQAYMVCLPWISTERKLSIISNEKQAVKRLLTLHKRMDPKLCKNYYEVLFDYLDRNITEIIPNSEIRAPGPKYYMPHHPVVKEQAISTKIRPVFDCSAKCPDGKSLNDHLHTGPSLNPDLVEILLRFRRWPVALSGDIKQAFLNIYMNPCDRDVHRFLMLIEGKIVHCRFIKLPFGNTSSPFILNATIRHHLRYFSGLEATTDLIKNTYVDNFISGDDDESSALQRFDEVCNILSSAGFVLDKWSSNQRSVISQFEVQQVHSEGNTILGLQWIASVDSFTFEGLNLHDSNVASTKISVLSNHI